MMSSEISTESGGAPADSAMRPWHFYLLLAMAGATWAVVESRHTSPAALLLLSAAILAAGAAGAALYYALSGFLGADAKERPVLDTRTRLGLEQDKALVLRSLKELEFDRAMNKIGEADFNEVSARLRERALSIMEDLEATSKDTPRGPVAVPAPDVPAASPEASICPACQTENIAGARFCNECGNRLS